jgi:hypothetical protein
MNSKKVSIPLPALLFAGAALLTTAAHAQDEDSDQSKPVDNYGVEWSNPSVFGARWRHVGASVTGTFDFADWESRKFQMSEGLITVTPARWLTVWYGDQRYFALGASGVARLNMSSDTYGFRAVICPPDTSDVGGLALQVQAWRPGTLGIVSGDSAEMFGGTGDVAYGVMGTNFGIDYEVQYSDITQPFSPDYANVFDFAVGKDFVSHGSKFQLRAEGHLLYQTVRTDAEDDASLRSMFYGAAGYDITRSLRLEGDVTAMPFGTALGGSELTPLTGFLVYNPGDPVDELRSKFFAVGALHLTYHVHF